MQISAALQNAIPQNEILKALRSGPGQYVYNNIQFLVIPGPNGLTALLPSDNLQGSYG